MRSDMAKLLTEAERYGSSLPSVKWGKRLKYDPNSDYEDEITRAPMSRKGQGRHNKVGWYGGKELSDVLNPLYGYLRKQIGRPWDDVYSELCQNLDRRSVSGNHVFQHLWGFVERYCYVEDDVAYDNIAHRWIEKSTVDGMYVHPETGILCEQLHPSRKQYEEKLRERTRQKEAEISFVKEKRIDAFSAHKRIEGIWYYTAAYDIKHEGLTHIPPSWNPESKLIPEIDPPMYRVTWTEHVYVQRQLNKKELKAAGLCNMRKEPTPFSRRERRRLSKV